MPADVETFRRLLANLRRLLLADLGRLGNDPSDLMRLVPPLVEDYGGMAAGLAADYYDEARETSMVPGSYLARPAVPDLSGLDQQLRWAVSPLLDPSLGGDAAGRVKQVADVHALQPARDTIADAAERDPAKTRWARVPTGAETCAFCLMLASRGARYRSRSTAAGKYHADCDCTPAPVWDAADMTALREGGYDPDALQRIYLDARDAAGSGDVKKILAEIRRAQGVA